MKSKTLLTAAVLALSATSISAAPIAVPNFSFEAQVLGSGGANAGSPTDWVLSGGGGVYHPNGSNFTAVGPLAAPGDGNQYAYLETATGNPGTVTLTSAASLATVVAGTTYTLTAAIGHRNFDAAGGRRPDDYKIELLVDGAPVATNTLSDAHTNIPSGTWVDLSTGFTAGASGGSLTIRLSHSSDDATFRQGAYDNIRLDGTVVPEPGSLALIGLGGLLIARRRR